MKAVLDEINDRLVLDPAWNEVELVKSVPGYRWIAKVQQHTVPLTWAALVQLRGLLGTNFTYGDDVSEWAWRERQTRVDLSLQWREIIHAEPWREGLDDLYPFQVAGVTWMLTAGSGLLGDELGCGKTPQALRWLHQQAIYGDDALPAIVICPNSLKWHWQVRVNRWCPTANVYMIDDKMINKRRKILEEAKQDPNALVIINYETVKGHSRLAPYPGIKLKRCLECDPQFGDKDVKIHQCHVHPKELNGFGFKEAIIDELHRCGEPTTPQTRAVWAVVHDPSVNHRWGLTGTPDNPERLWSMMHTVMPSEYPVKGKWMERHVLTAFNAYGGRDVVGLRPDTREELFRYLDPRFRRMLKSVILPQLPPIVRQVRYAELTSAQRKAYDDLEKRLFTTLPNGQFFITQNKMISRMRLLQFAAGTITVDKPDEDDITTWKVHIGLPSPKLDVMEEVLDELGRDSFVVACENVELAEMAAERLGNRGIKHQIIAGSVHPSVIQQATQDLSAGTLQAIVFTHSKGGEGLDMSGAGTMIILQRTWSLIKEIQTENRAHRIGSEKFDSVRIIDIVTRDTREERQVKKLHQKLEQMEEINRDRARIQGQLAQTPPTHADFISLIATLDTLNTRHEKLINQDDLEEMMLEDMAGE